MCSTADINLFAGLVELLNTFVFWMIESGIEGEWL